MKNLFKMFANCDRILDEKPVMCPKIHFTPKDGIMAPKHVIKNTAVISRKIVGGHFA